MFEIIKSRKRMLDEYRLEKSELKKKPNVPDGLYEKCDHCGISIHKDDLVKNQFVCKDCGHHFKISAWNRIHLLVDTDSFKEYYSYLRTTNPLDFKDYDKKIEGLVKKNKMNEAVVVGIGKINNEKCVIAAMDPFFLMGSMGSVVGEKITRAIEKATSLKLPLIIISCSGGARMQEGIYSLMQMAKTSAALAKHDKEGLLFISVLTNPTTGGVTASFASLGDINIAEPNALIGFAGPRVIEQTIRQKLPDGFQSAQFQLEKGFVDMVVDRRNMKETLSKLLQFHKGVKS